jgi:hypothetical protein
LSVLDPEVYRDYNRLKIVVLEAWNIIIDAKMRDMIHTILTRCLTIKKADRLYIDF